VEMARIMEVAEVLAIVSQDRSTEDMGESQDRVVGNPLASLTGLLGSEHIVSQFP
jgi:hypothetical protein